MQGSAVWGTIPILLARRIRSDTEAPQARKVDGGPTYFDTQRCPEQIDLDTFNPTHRDPAITTNAQLHSCSRRSERKPSTFIEEVLADRRTGQFGPKLRCNPHDRSYESVRVRTGPCSIVTPMAVSVIGNRR